MDLARFGANLRKIAGPARVDRRSSSQGVGHDAAGCQRVAAGSSPAKQQVAVRHRPGVRHGSHSASDEDTQTLLPVFGDQDRYAETQARLKKQLRSLKAVR